MINKQIKEIIDSEKISYKSAYGLVKFIASKLKKNESLVKERLNKMLEDGELFEVKKGNIISLPSKNYIKGKFIGTLKGFGYCKAPGREKDVFIAPSQLRTAMDGDEVVVKIISQNNEFTDGTVLSILKRANKTIVGELTESDRGFYLSPDNKRITNTILVAKGKNMSAGVGQKVLCKIEFDFTKKNLPAEVIEILGESEDVKTLQLAIIRANNLFEVFPNEVLEEIKRIPDSVREIDKKGRIDLTKETVFTIDGFDAKDFDDAVSIKKTAGGYELGVHIADVTEYVKENTALDQEAMNRGTSVYFPNMVLPMLPERLSNGICSLKEGVLRLTLSVIIEYDENANVKGYKVFESFIKSVKRLTYTEVFDCARGKKVGESVARLKKYFELMLELAEKLEQKRKGRGALDLDIPESQFLFDENGYVNGVMKRERNDAHRLIESFMVACNEVVAKEFCNKKIPFVYRVHESPTLQKIKEACAFLEGLDLSVPNPPNKIEPKYLQELLDLLAGKPYAEAANKVILRSLQKARYANECLGHFGLALDFYSHFTSPIRRYPDLAIHRIIKETLKAGGKLKKDRLDDFEEFSYLTSMESSNRERLADIAERDVDDLWKAYLMKDRVGEVFDGVITSVASFGFFVGLENSVEGLVRLESLAKDGYLFLEKSLKLKGPDRIFSIGDQIKVRLQNVSLETRRIDFILNL